MTIDDNIDGVVDAINTTTTTTTTTNITTNSITNNTIVEDDHQQKPINSALILQCGQCRTVAGNTLSICHTDPVTRTISCQRGYPSILVDQDTLHTSMDPHDYGSTYHRFGCRECGSLLGRVYRTTSPELDQVRGILTFDVDRLLMTELWDEDPIGGMQQQQQTSMQSSIQSSMQINNSNENNIDAPLVPSNMEVLKLQKFCLFLYERVVRLERLLGGSGGGSASGDKKRPAARMNKIFDSEETEEAEDSNRHQL